MKKTLFAFLMLLGMTAKAEPLSLDFGSFTLLLPLQVVTVTQLYEFSEQKGFTGAETLLVSRGRFDLTAGAATGYTGSVAFPFVAVQAELPDTFFDTADNDLKFGLWVGRDFGAKDTKFGIKASLPLW